MREPVKKAHKNGIVRGQSLGGTEQFLGEQKSRISSVRMDQRKDENPTRKTYSKKFQS